MDRTQITCAVIGNLENLISIPHDMMKVMVVNAGFKEGVLKDPTKASEAIAAVQSLVINSLVDAIIAGAKESS